MSELSGKKEFIISAADIAATESKWMSKQKEYSLKRADKGE